MPLSSYTAPFMLSNSVWRFAIGIGVGSVTALLPAISHAANELPGVPIPAASLQTNDIQPSWQKPIEQQQIWQDTLQQQRIDSLRQSQLQHESETDNDLIESQPDSIVNTDLPPNTPLLTPEVDCLPVQRIELGTLPELGQAAQAELRQQAQRISVSSSVVSSQIGASNQAASNMTQPLMDNDAQCVTVADANALLRSVTEAYLDAGFFKISIDPVTVYEHTSIWHIHVAKIAAIDNQTELSTSRLFGDVIGKPANMAVLDQAVSNGERVIDGQLILDVYPVGEGDKDVQVQVSQQGEVETFSGDIEWRYDPDDSYGHNQIKLTGKLGNAFGQADLTSISIQQSLTDKYGYDEDNQRRSASLYSVIPNGQWQWSGLLAADEYDRTTQLTNSVLEQSGDTWQANIRGDFTFDRDQDSISTIYGQLAHQDVTNEVLGSELDIQSPTLSSGRIGMSHTKLFNNRSNSEPNKVMTGAWVVDLSVEKGFGNHDNPATEQGLKDDYLRWLLSGYLTHQHSLVTDGQRRGYWQMTHELQGQYSDDKMFGITHQSLGSTYSGVRGIDNAYSAAESGITLRNTLSFEPMQTSWSSFGNQKIRWSPYVGVDYGVVKYADSGLDDDTSDAASATIGLKLIGYDEQDIALDRQWQLEVSASRAHTDYPNQDTDGTQDTEISAAWQWYF